jgi:hypothetical protein
LLSPFQLLVDTATILLMSTVHLSSKSFIQSSRSHMRIMVRVFEPRLIFMSYYIQYCIYNIFHNIIVHTDVMDTIYVKLTEITMPPFHGLQANW